MKKRAPSPSSPFPISALLAVLLLLAALTVSQFSSRRSDISDTLPATSTADTFSAAPSTPTEAAGQAGTLRQRLLEAETRFDALMADLSDDPAHVVASSTSPDGAFRYAVITSDAMGTPPKTDAAVSEACYNSLCAIYVREGGNPWRRVEQGWLGAANLLEAPTWVGGSRILAVEGFGDGPSLSRRYWLIDPSEAKMANIGIERSLYDTLEDMNSPTMRGQVSYEFTNGASHPARNIEVAYDAGRGRWLATVFVSGRQAGAPVALPNPPRTGTETKTATLLPGETLDGKADIAFAWFGKTYLLNGKTITAK